MNPYVGIVQIRYAGLSGCLLSAERLPVFVHFMIGRNRRLVKAGMQNLHRFAARELYMAAVLDFTRAV